MNNIADKLNEVVISRNLIGDQIKESNTELDSLNGELVACIEAREIIQKAAEMTQQELGVRLSDTVSQALGLVFSDLGLGFTAKFITRRNSTECDMFITEDGKEYDPLSSCGFGAADVVSFALRVAMWSLNKTAPFMVFDEPFRNLDEDRMPSAAILLSTLSEELGIQMIVVTHEEALKTNAGKAYRVTKLNGISKVVLEKLCRIN